MEFLKDDGISFCSFFEIIALDNEEKKEKSENKVHLHSVEQNEKVMILYSKD
ncbi:MAG: hypothetical protein PUB96_02280 [Helicobacteraceae bacterium]|nr:hypothetical protein [Helicobacteraceae bacterium]